MIDPLAIADDIERRAAAYGTDFPVMLTQRGAPLLVAAIRLAEATATWHQLRRRMMTCDLATTARRQREESDAMDRIVEAVAAYRAAKEKA